MFVLELVSLCFVFFLAIETEPESDCLGMVYVFISYLLGLSKAHCLNSLMHSVM